MENHKHIKKIKKLFHPIRLIVLLLIFLGLSFTLITYTDGRQGVQVPPFYSLDGQRIYSGDTMHIRGLSSSGEVCTFKNNSQGDSYFIPTRSQLEWNAVKSATDGGHANLELLGCGCNVPWGVYIYHGESVIAYNTSFVDCGTCPSQVRTCSNGTLTGTYTHENCSAGTCPSGYYCDYPNNTCIQDSNPCTPYTCSNKSSLESANEGFHCGLGLNDGCGGTINCVNNCSTGQVCATCRPGFDDFDDCYSQSGTGNTQGVCSTDTICNAVVDVANMNQRGRSFCIDIHGPTFPDCPANSSAISSLRRIRHINGVCQISPIGGNYINCQGNLPTPEPYWVTFDGINTKTEILADPQYNNIILQSCIPDGGGDDPPPPGEGDDPPDPL